MLTSDACGCERIGVGLGKHFLVELCAEHQRGYQLSGEWRRPMTRMVTRTIVKRVFGADVVIEEESVEPGDWYLYDSRRVPVSGYSPDV